MAPQVFDGEVIVGSPAREWAVRGFVAAYDAHTGKQRWRWWSTDPKTFAGNSWKTAAVRCGRRRRSTPSSIWSSSAPANPNPDLEDANARRNQSLHRLRSSRSTRAPARCAGTIKRSSMTSGTTMRRATSSCSTFTATAQTIPAAGQAGKVGWYFMLDRRTGKLLRKSQPFGAQNANISQGRRACSPARTASRNGRRPLIRRRPITSTCWAWTS